MFSMEKMTLTCLWAVAKRAFRKGIPPFFCVGRIDAGESDELFIGPEASSVAHLGKKQRGGDVADAMNRGNDLEILLHGALAKLDQRLGHLSQALV